MKWCFSTARLLDSCHQDFPLNLLVTIIKEQYEICNFDEYILNRKNYLTFSYACKPELILGTTIQLLSQAFLESESFRLHNHFLESICNFLMFIFDLFSVLFVLVF